MIRINNNTITLTRPGQKDRAYSTDSLERVYCLQVGSDLLSNDSNCYLFVFQTEMWLLPDTVSGLTGLITGKYEFPATTNVIHASLDYLPYFWRANWHVLPGTTAKLKVIALDELESLLSRVSIFTPRQL